MILGHDLYLSRSRDVIGHMTSRSAICHFLLVSHWIWNRVSSFNRFRDIRPLNPCAPTEIQTHAASDFISRPYLVRSRLCDRLASVCLSSVCRLRKLCIVAKRRVLEKKLLLAAYRKSYEKSIGTKMIRPWPFFRGRIKVTSTIALHFVVESRKPLEIEHHQ